MLNRIKSGMHTAGEWKWKPPKRAMRAGSSYEAEEGDSKLEALTAWRRVKQLLRSSATDARNARKKGGGSAKALQAEQIRSAGLSDDRKARQSNSCVLLLLRYYYYYATNTTTTTTTITTTNSLRPS